MRLARYKNIKYDCISVHEVGPSVENDSDRVRVSDIVNVYFPDLSKEDIALDEIAALASLKGEVRVSMQSKINAIEDKIQSLLAITHEVES